MKIGILKEGKVPTDARTPVVPEHFHLLKKQFPNWQFVVRPCPFRCFIDDEYIAAGFQMQDDLSDCDVLLGIKEVKIQELIPDKTYFFFSHTIKKQPHNQKLIQALLSNKIRMIDYETLVYEDSKRVIAFGKWAGVVGAHNAMYSWGQRSGAFGLKRACEVSDYEELQHLYSKMDFPPIKIVLTGGGRVANGALETLHHMGIKKVDPKSFLEKSFPHAVFTQLNSIDLYERISDGHYSGDEFHKHPERYRCHFQPFYAVSDLMINAIFWQPGAPQFFNKDEMKRPDFRIRVIADVTCDIAPEASVPSTLRASTIADPVYGYDALNEKEIPPYTENSIDIMAIDNLPNELPRDASREFSHKLISEVLPELYKTYSDMLGRATICRDGDLGSRFEYLRDYAFPAGI